MSSVDDIAMALNLDRRPNDSGPQTGCCNGLVPLSRLPIIPGLLGLPDVNDRPGPYFDDEYRCTGWTNGLGALPPLGPPVLLEFEASDIRSNDGDDECDEDLAASNERFEYGYDPGAVYRSDDEGPYAAGLPAIVNLGLVEYRGILDPEPNKTIHILYVKQRSKILNCKHFSLT